MKTFNAVVIDPVGLHARPATEAVKAASKFKCDVTVAKADGTGRTANMKSIMAVMSLGIPTQTEITVTCNGEGEEVAAAELEKVLREQKVIA